MGAWSRWVNPQSFREDKKTEGDSQMRHSGAGMERRAEGRNYKVGEVGLNLSMREE